MLADHDSFSPSAEGQHRQGFLRCVLAMLTLVCGVYKSQRHRGSCWRRLNLNAVHVHASLVCCLMVASARNDA